MANKIPKVQILDASITEDQLEKAVKDEGYFTPLIKSIVNSYDSGKKITRLALEEAPDNIGRYAGLYLDKINLLPDRIIKRISIVDDLVAAIIRARGNQVSAFGHPLQDRYSTGYRIEPKKYSKFNTLKPEKKAELLKRVVEITRLLYNCGHRDRWDFKDKMSFPTFLYLSASNAVRFGRFATEFVYLVDDDGKKTFQGFRPADPETIYRAMPKSKQADKVREQAKKLIEQIKNEKLVAEKFENEEYAYVQVIEGRPVQAFTADEMVVYNCYPVTDIETNGYPLTPIDTVISAITTHINITSHNKLYFQAGRASKGMLILKSDNIDPGTLQDLKQQFNAAINSVVNSWRMPVIKVGQQDDVDWKPIDQGGRDMEFQYLSDSNARTILSAFNISPEEVPGYAHLSKGTNNQALSESSNEYKLEAARDVGIRPLLASMEDFLNSYILPVLDRELAEYCAIKLYGLDAETPEREATRIRNEQELWGTINNTLKTVDKEMIPKSFGGDFPLNPMFKQILDQYLTVGQIKEYFMGQKGAAQDPKWDYCRDQFYFSQSQILMQKEQMQQQQQMIAQQQAAAASGQPQVGQETGGPQQDQQAQQGQPQEGAGDDLKEGVEQAIHHVHNKHSR